MIPKIEQDILLHPNTLELVCETQFLSVVQRLHELIETEEICLLSDHLPRTNENTCIDLVLNLCFQREQLDYYCSSCLSNICQERNIYYRQLLFSATRLDKALEYLCIENTCLQKWKQKSLPISIGCFRSCKSCELLAEIEKWQHFETKHTSTRDKMFIGNS